MLKPFETLPDGRKVYRFEIAGVEYHVRMPYSEEVRIRESQIASKYAGQVQESGVIPAEFMIDRQYANWLAAIIKPIGLTVEKLRKLPYPQHHALSEALDKTVQINDRSEIKFLDESDVPGAVADNEGIRLEFQSSASTLPTGNTLPVGRVDVVQQVAARGAIKAARSSTRGKDSGVGR